MSRGAVIFVQNSGSEANLALHTALALWHTASRLFPENLAKSISNKITALLVIDINMNKFQIQ
jgi:hypothetical protein